MINVKFLAVLSLLGALLLTGGAYGADWPGWLRGALLGALAALAVNLTVNASRAQRSERSKVTERSE